jgi:hypothetical protein
MLSAETVEREYMDVISKCENVFIEKDTEYGATWTVYRWGSLIDQLWMKIKRIRTIEESGNRIPDTADTEYMALINYALVFLMRLKNTDVIESSDIIIEDIKRLDDYSKENIIALYRIAVKEAFELYSAKNHDYNNAWQDMSVPTITDLIIIKVLRIKNIIRRKTDIQYNDVDQQLFDIINYSIFALIKLRQFDGA